MRHASQVAALFVLVAIPTSPLQSQAQPGQGRPKELTIIIETEKLGHGPAHAKLEADWSAANARAGFTDFYLGLTSVTGAPEQWWISGYGSNEERGKVSDQSPRVTAVGDRFSALDAAHVDAVRTLFLTHRPELSVGDPVDIAAARGMEVTRWRIRPGHDQAFAAAAKTYFGVARRAGVAMSSAAYEVTAGALAGTYLTLTAMKAPGDYDRMMSDGEKVFGAFTAEEGAALTKFLSESVISMETNRFRFVPDMSVLPAEWVQRDPGFWTPSWKKVAAKP